MRAQTDENPTYHAIDELFAIETGMPRYSLDIIKRIIEKIEPGNLFAVCEFGAGTGFLSILFNELTGVRPNCVEIDPTLIRILKDRKFRVKKSLKEWNGRFDLIYSANVLEHVPDDLKTLKQMYASLNDGGQVAVFVPAFPLLFSEMDQRVGHVRRYRKRQLKQICEDAGFTIEYISYTDPIGFFGNLLVRVVGWRRGLVNLGGQKSTLFYENYLLSLSKFLEKFGTGLFLGKNLLLIGRKV